MKVLEFLGLIGVLILLEVIPFLFRILGTFFKIVFGAILIVILVGVLAWFSWIVWTLISAAVTGICFLIRYLKNRKPTVVNDVKGEYVDKVEVIN